MFSVLQGIRDYAEQQKRLLSDIAAFSARNLAILAGLSPAQTNSNSAVNTSVPVSQCSSQPAEVDSAAADTTGGTSSTVSASSVQFPSLSLSQSIARSETLESPAYVPSDFCLLQNDVTPTLATSDKQRLDTESEPKNAVPVLSDGQQSHGAVATISIENEMPALSAPAYEKLMPAQQATSGKTSKFAASVRRKFTVSKTVLPSTAVPQVVVFSKLATEASDASEVTDSDDAGRVHIVDKAHSNSSSPSATLTDVPTSSAATLESTVIAADGIYACNTDSDNVNDVSELQQKSAECDTELEGSSEVGVVAHSETSDDKVSDDHYSGSVGAPCVQQFEVYSVPPNNVTPDHAAVAQEPLCQVNDWVRLLYKDAEISSSSDECAVLTKSCLTSVDDVGTNCSADACNSDFSSLQYVAHELPCNAASDDVLVAQLTDAITSCSTLEEMIMDMPLEASSLSSDNLDALQHNDECDHDSQIAESMPVVIATQCNSLVQGQE